MYWRWRASAGPLRRRCASRIASSSASRQLQVLLQLAQLRRPHPRQADAELLQRFGLALARRAARALEGRIAAAPAGRQRRPTLAARCARSRLLKRLPSRPGPAARCYNRRRNHGTGQGALPRTRAATRNSGMQQQVCRKAGRCLADQRTQGRWSPARSTEAQSSGASQAEADASLQRGLTVTVRLGEVETIEYHRDRGLVGHGVFRQGQGLGQHRGSAPVGRARDGGEGRGDRAAHGGG